MNKELYIDLCQRLRGLRAAQKNLHYTFEMYGEHLMTDRFAEGDDNGFDCNGIIDEVQECVAMYYGAPMDEIELDTYPEEYSLSLTEISGRAQAFGKVSDLFNSLIEMLDSASAESGLNVGEQNLIGAIAQSAMRAKGFYDRLKGVTDGKTEPES